MLNWDTLYNIKFSEDALSYFYKINNETVSNYTRTKTNSMNVK